MIDPRQKEFAICMPDMLEYVGNIVRSVEGGELRTYDSEWDPIRADVKQDHVGWARIPPNSFRQYGSMIMEAPNLAFIDCRKSGTHKWYACFKVDGSCAFYGKISLNPKSDNTLVLGTDFSMAGSNIEVVSFKISVGKVFY